MGMNIKNPETQRLRQELAAITGESLTTAIAVRERLARVRREQGSPLAQALLSIGKKCASRLREPYRSAAHTDLVCDERGQPR